MKPVLVIHWPVAETFQLLTVFNQKAEVIAVIDAFSSVKEKCEGLQSGESFPVDEKMEVVFELPDEEDWRYEFFLLEYESQESCPISEEAMADIAGGSYFVIPLNQAQARSFGIAEVRHPQLTVIFCLQDSNKKSFVVAVGPGPGD